MTRCNNPLPHAAHDYLDLNGSEWECSGKAMPELTPSPRYDDVYDEAMKLTNQPEPDSAEAAYTPRISTTVLPPDPNECMVEWSRGDRYQFYVKLPRYIANAIITDHERAAWAVQVYEHHQGEPHWGGLCPEMEALLSRYPQTSRTPEKGAGE